ncbi:MAG: hypothetical protein KGZ75_02095 [Syntrophomonadaceae bacterium]|nr:hypothetical protein [Syntrophomonadaceae bacterium]
MTHSLHRRGSLESLKEDFVLLATAAAGINHQGSKDKLRRILELVYEIGPANIGSYDTGTVFAGVSIEEIKAALAEVPRVRCSFSSKEKMFQVIKGIKELDLGISITASGVIDEVLDIARQLDIKPHSVNLSLGVWGKTEELPPEDILEHVTMCGHGLITKDLVAKVIEDVKAGKKTPRQAAELLAHPCVCGIYNPDRAEKMLAKYAPAEKPES